MNRLLIILLLYVVACSKPADKKDVSYQTLLEGKWKYTEYYISAGPPGEWKPVQPANQVIEFKTDGTFIASQSFLNSYRSYEILDSVKVRFKQNAATPAYLTMLYDFKSVKGGVILSPIDPACIEGCSYKFLR